GAVERAPRRQPYLDRPQPEVPTERDRPFAALEALDHVLELDRGERPHSGAGAAGTLRSERTELAGRCPWSTATRSTPESRCMTWRTVFGVRPWLRRCCWCAASRGTVSACSGSSSSSARWRSSAQA